MNARTPDSHYPWTRKWGAGQPVDRPAERLWEEVLVAFPHVFCLVPHQGVNDPLVHALRSQDRREQWRNVWNPGRFAHFTERARVLFRWSVAESGVNLAPSSRQIVICPPG